MHDRPHDLERAGLSERVELKPIIHYRPLRSSMALMPCNGKAALAR